MKEVCRIFPIIVAVDQTQLIGAYSIPFRAHDTTKDLTGPYLTEVGRKYPSISVNPITVRVSTATSVIPN